MEGKIFMRFNLYRFLVWIDMIRNMDRTLGLKIQKILLI